MKTFLYNLSANPKFNKIIHWVKLISITGGAQTIVQVTGLVCGILIIRLLPTQEYAYYTLANTMLGTMTILSDGGISTGVMVQGGKVWGSREELGKVLATGLDLRKKFAFASLIISCPILFFLLWHHGASLLFCSLIILSLIPAFFAALSDSLLEVAPKLNQDVVVLQKNQIFANVGRLVVTSLSLFIFPWTFIAILANGIPRIVANIRLRKISAKFADPVQIPDPVIRKNILASVYRILPLSVYYCVSGQINIWLLSFFGNTTSLAQVGALGRLAMLLSIFDVLFSTLVIPRFARLQAEKKILLSRYLSALGAIVLTCLLIVGATILFPSQILYILGKKYGNLKTEILLTIISSCLSMLAGQCYSLYSHRGWVMKPVWGIATGISIIICGALIFNVSELRGILLFNIFVSLVGFIVNFIFGLIKILNLKNAVPVAIA